MTSLKESHICMSGTLERGSSFYHLYSRVSSKQTQIPNKTFCTETQNTVFDHALHHPHSSLSNLSHIRPLTFTGNQSSLLSAASSLLLALRPMLWIKIRPCTNLKASFRNTGPGSHHATPSAVVVSGAQTHSSLITTQRLFVFIIRQQPKINPLTFVNSSIFFWIQRCN